MRKATVHVPGIEEGDMTDKPKCEQWIKKSKGVKGKISHSMRKIKCTENKGWIQKLITSLQKEGGE
jgi:hypothetical protein